MRILTKFLIIAVIIFTGCKNRVSVKPKEIIIFHAGSLSVPFKQLADEYEKKNPGIKILREAAGSLVCARKITELNKPCDIIASADYFVINELLIPEYASWSIRFATNEMVLSFTDKSRHAEKINSENWYEIISLEDVVYSRADPDADPGGYRTVFTFKLTEIYYKLEGLAEKLMSKDINYIRPKEVDLIALLESNSVDYIFIYKSVAVQHNLKYVSLPPEINLSDPKYNELYKTVSLEVTGNSADSRITIMGEYINYSLTVLKDAPNSAEAIEFVLFLLGREGMDIIRMNGQEPLVPFIPDQPDLIPVKLHERLTLE